MVNRRFRYKMLMTFPMPLMSEEVLEARIQ